MSVSACTYSNTAHFLPPCGRICIAGLYEKVLVGSPCSSSVIICYLVLQLLMLLNGVLNPTFVNGGFMCSTGLLPERVSIEA